MRAERRWREWGKSALIAGLGLSALWLLTMTPLVRDSGLLDRTPEDPHAREHSSIHGEVTLSAAAYPSRMAVNTAAGRYGVQYNQDQVDRLFAQAGPLLGEALTGAQQPRPLDEDAWREQLGQPGVYFDFSGQIPLSALGGWLLPGGSCPLPGAARRLVLTQGEDDRVSLSYQEASGAFYTCPTQLSAQLHLNPLVEQAQGNGAAFAFEREDYAGLLDPYTLITEQMQAGVYAASTPLAAGGDLSELLDALSFNGQNHASISGGEAFLEGTSRLEVQQDGTVRYRATREGKYPVAHAGSQPTLAEMIETTRQLAQDTVGAHCGQARIHLISARETGEGWQIRYGYQLNGSDVWLYQEGWAAQFLVRDGYVAEFTLHLRSYDATGEQALLLPLERAVVMLPALTQEGRELVVQYRDGAGGSARPMWVAQ